jgi:hypothetical protein
MVGLCASLWKSLLDDLEVRRIRTVEEPAETRGGIVTVAAQAE